MKRLRRIRDGIIYPYHESTALLDTMEVFDDGEPTMTLVEARTKRDEAKNKSAAKKDKVVKLKAKAKTKTTTEKSATPKKEVSSPASIVDDLNSDLGQTDELHDS